MLGLGPGPPQAIGNREPREGRARRAAEFLNINNVEVVSVQHEFGIYGGPAGSHLMTFLREVRRPVVTTLHTILSDPNADQRLVMEQLDRYSSRFIVMAERGQRMLETVYGVDPGKIDLIPHGVIDMPFIDSNFFKDVFGVEGKTTFTGIVNPANASKNVIPIPLKASNGVNGSGAAALGVASANQPFLDLRLSGVKPAPKGSAYIVWFVVA